ncbi:uncharacterized protein n4bp2l2 [Xenentodon cancila]
MSRPELSSTSFNTIVKPGGDQNTENCGNNTFDENPKCVRNNRSSPDRCVRDRVLKEVGITSTAFIGPAFPPETPTAKSDIEDTLSEFYKELEEIDTPDDANGRLGKRNDQPVIGCETPASRETQKAPEEKTPSSSCSAETNSYYKKSGHAQSSWPHWHQNEPYHLRRPDGKFSSSVSDHNQWHSPHPLKRPRQPRFHGPHLLHQPHHSELAHPHNMPTNISLTFKSSETTDHYERFLPSSSFPPPNMCTDPSRGFDTNPAHHFGRDDQVCSHDAYSDNAAAGWSRDRNEGYWFDDDYDRPQRIKAEDEQWEPTHHYKPPSNTRHSASVLILMRGLPGSGKTTLARELLSTGPSGVILSTDDYFAHRGDYRYDPGLLSSAHDWNQSRAEDALHNGRSPVIIDNTNLQAWEMKPYVRMALERGYEVHFCEPDTRWKFDPFELEKRNKHGVPQEKIAQMMDRFSFPISIDIVMSSQDPSHVMHRRYPEQQLQQLQQQQQQLRRNRDFL